MLDLGRDGYARALRGEFDALPPLVVTPTFATADSQLEWLNRVQGIGVGRGLTPQQIEFDVYIIRTGGHKTAE